MSEVSLGGSSDVFAQCPSGCVCGVRDLVARQVEHGPRPADEVDAAEMRSLLTAVRNGYETVRSDRRLAERRHAATDAYARADHQLNRMFTMLAEHRLSSAAVRARRDESRLETEGSRRPSWIRWLRWPTIIGIGTFDAWYFAQVFRYLTSQTGDAVEGTVGAGLRTVEAFVAVVPGVVLAVIIATSGELLLRPLRAWKAAAFPKADPGAEEKSVRDDAPDGKRQRGRNGPDRALRAVGRWLLRITWWSLPVVFVAFLLAVIAAWAGLRAEFANGSLDNGYPTKWVMLLIVLLTVGAMAVKILADDPAADDRAKSHRRLWRMRREYLWHSRRADRLIAGYDSTWRDLRTLRDDLNGLLRIKMVSAWEGYILRIRSLHRMAGNVTAAPWPADSAELLSHPEFENVPQPSMELGSLREVCRLIDERPPDELRKRKTALDAEYAAQISGRREIEVMPAS